MLYNIDATQIATVRTHIIDSVNARIDWEKQNPAQRSLESKLDYLVGFRKRVERADAFALGFLNANPVAFDSVFLSHRRSNEAFNIYAMPKALEVARCLNGGALQGTAGGDHMTLAGTLLAMHEGITLESKIAHRVNTYANNECSRPNYSSGATQASSSLRALEAFGIVKKTGKLGNCQLWGINDAARFARMIDAAQGNSAATVTREMEAQALADNSDSMSKAGRQASRKAGKAGKAGKAVSATIPAASATDAASDVPAPASVDADTQEAGAESAGDAVTAF